jgi:hypothetical protein
VKTATDRPAPAKRRINFRHSQPGELPAKAVDPSVKGIATIAARREETFRLVVQGRGSRPRLEPDKTLGFLEQLFRVSGVLGRGGMAQNGGEQDETREPNQRSGAR